MAARVLSNKFKHSFAKDSPLTKSLDWDKDARECQRVLEIEFLKDITLPEHDPKLKPCFTNAERKPRRPQPVSSLSNAF